MERRKAIKNIGLSLGTMVATPSILSLLQSCQAQEAPWVPAFYTEEQGKFVKNLIDTILPASGDLPSAIDVNVHVFVDKYVQEVMSVDEKPRHRESLEMAMNSLLRSAEAESVNDLEDEDYEAFLVANLKKSKADHDEIMSKIWSYGSDNKGNFSGMEESLTVYQFLSQIRDLSIWSYKISEQVGEKVMAYKPVPGEQRGCVDLQEATGGMAWSL